MSADISLSSGRGTIPHTNLFVFMHDADNFLENPLGKNWLMLAIFLRRNSFLMISDTFLVKFLRWSSVLFGWRDMNRCLKHSQKKAGYLITSVKFILSLWWTLATEHLYGKADATHLFRKRLVSLLYADSFVRCHFVCQFARLFVCRKKFSVELPSMKVYAQRERNLKKTHTFWQVIHFYDAVNSNFIIAAALPETNILTNPFSQ